MTKDCAWRATASPLRGDHGAQTNADPQRGWMSRELLAAPVDGEKFLLTIPFIGQAVTFSLRLCRMDVILNPLEPFELELSKSTAFLASDFRSIGR